MGRRILERALSGLLVLGAVTLCTACTSINKATFAIEPSGQAQMDDVLRGIEAYFATLGIKLERKTNVLYPEPRKLSTYFLGHRVGLNPLHSSYHHVRLRLEPSGRLYIDWIEITDVPRPQKPESFAATHAKIAREIKDRVGVDVVFRFVEDP